MNIEFRKFLIYLQKKRNNIDENKKTSTFLGLIIFISFILSFVLDKILPVNIYTSFIKMFISLIFGCSLFSIVYIKLYEILEKTYNDLSNEYSYKQRLNISILILSAVIALFVFFVSNKAIVYTLLTGFIIFIMLLMFYFNRETRNEYYNKIYNISDERDIKHINEVKFRDEELLRKEEEKRLKNQDKKEGE